MKTHISEDNGLDPYKRTVVIELEQYEGKIVSTEVIAGGKGIRLNLELRDDMFVQSEKASKKLERFSTWCTGCHGCSECKPL